MTDQTMPRRRGRPPQTPQATAPSQIDEKISDADVKPLRRRRRASVGGHALKLSAPSKDGHVRRWVNDDGNRLADAQELGYDFVTEKGIKTDSPGSRVSRLVGTKKNGEPLHAYLMETPDELYAEGVAEKAAEVRRIDQAISTGGTQDSQIDQIPSSERYGKIEVRRA